MTVPRKCPKCDSFDVSFQFTRTSLFCRPFEYKLESFPREPRYSRCSPQYRLSSTGIIKESLEGLPVTLKAQEMVFPIQVGDSEYFLAFCNRCNYAWDHKIQDNIFPFWTEEKIKAAVKDNVDRNNYWMRERANFEVLPPYRWTLWRIWKYYDLWRNRDK
jgi:hypothetical protein